MKKTINDTKKINNVLAYRRKNNQNHKQLGEKLYLCIEIVRGLLMTRVCLEQVT